MDTQCTQYSTRWRFLLVRNRGVNIPLHLRATTVLTASYVFGNRSREDSHTVNQIGPNYQGFESRSGKVSFYLKRPLNLLFPGLKRPGSQAKHSPPSSAQVKNEWRHISIHPLRAVKKNISLYSACMLAAFDLPQLLMGIPCLAHLSTASVNVKK